MNKSAVLQAILTALHQEFEAFRALSKKTRAASGDDESKAEGKYDTRATEESYLADGQAKQALAAANALKAFERLGLRDFPDGAAADLGALVQLEFPGETAWFFLGPAAGGLEIEIAGVSVTVITPESPLGRQLPGLTRGGATTAPKAVVRAIA